MREADLMRRYRELEAAAEGHPSSTSTPAPVMRAQPSEVHRQAVELLDELLGAVGPASGPFAIMARTLRRLEPALLSDLADVPPERIAGFMQDLGRRMLAVGAEPAEPAGAPEPAGSAVVPLVVSGSLADLPTGA